MARRKIAPSLKAKIALEAIRNDMTIQELAKKYEVHPNMIQKWKSDLIKQSAMVFEKGNKQDGTREKHLAQLERKIGQQAVEIDFLKKMSWDTQTRASKND